MRFEFNRDEEKINLGEMLKLSHLEIKEALHVFGGVETFSAYYNITSEYEKAYLRRDTIQILMEENFPNKRYHTQFLSRYKALLREIDFLYFTECIARTYGAGDLISMRVNDYHYGDSNDAQFIYLLETEYLVNWALGPAGMVFAKNIQDILSIKQIDSKKGLNKSQTQHLCLQALAQVLWYTSIDPEESQQGIINKMKNILSEELHGEDGAGEQSQSERTECWPLWSLWKSDGIKYFCEEKTTILNTLVKDVDPRPNEFKLGRPKKREVHFPFPPKLISGIYKHDGDCPAINFQKLNVVFQALGHYLCCFRLVRTYDELLNHPLIQVYIDKRCGRTNSFANFCLRKVCPESFFLKNSALVENDFKYSLSYPIAEFCLPKIGS